MEDAMNKCTASAFQSSEIVHCLKFLRDAYCSERISAAHKAVVKADLNRAIDSVLHANAEFCQGGSVIVGGSLCLLSFSPLLLFFKRKGYVKSAVGSDHVGNGALRLIQNFTSARHSLFT